MDAMTVKDWLAVVAILSSVGVALFVFMGTVVASVIGGLTSLVALVVGFFTTWAFNAQNTAHKELKVEVADIKKAKDKSHNDIYAKIDQKEDASTAKLNLIQTDVNKILVKIGKMEVDLRRSTPRGGPDLTKSAYDTQG